MLESLIQYLIPILTGVAQSNPVVAAILGILGTLVLAGQAIVAFTPSTADDAAWAKIKAVPLVGQLLAVVVSFAPWHKS